MPIPNLKLSALNSKKRSNNVVTSYDLLGIADIRNGIICRSDGVFALPIEISPLNFKLRSEQEQEDIVFIYATIFRIIRSPFQVSTLSQRADLSAHIDFIARIMDKEIDPNIRRQQEEYINFARDVTARNAVARRFFITLFYSGQGGYESASSKLYEQKGLIKQAFSKIGNDIIETDPDYLAAEMLYNFLNRSRAENQQLPSLRGRNGGEYLRLILPSGIDGSIPDAVVIDGTWTSSMIAINYPYQVSAAWLDSLINSGEGVEISLFHEPFPRGEALRDVTQNIGFTSAALLSGKNQVDSGIQFNSLQHAQLIKAALSEGKDLWNMYLTIRISAPTQELLKTRERDVAALLDGQSIFYEKCDFRQLEAWKHSLPCYEPFEAMKRRMARNVIDEDLASTYPFTSYELADPEGVLCGLNSFNGSPVMLDIFNTKQYANANGVIIGRSGSGKTFTTQLLASRLRLQSIPITLICPLKGFEYRRLCENLGGSYIRIAPGSEYRINIFDIKPPADKANRGESLVAQKIQKLRTYMYLIFPQITPLELQMLDEHLLAIYEKRGIVPSDNNSIYMGSEAGKIRVRKTLKEMPTFGDLYEQIKDVEQLSNISVQLRPYVSGTLSCLNGQTTIDPDNDYVIYDISEMPGDGISLAMFMAVDQAWEKIKQDNTRKKALIIDEVWRLIGNGANEYTAEAVLEIFKTIRGYGGSAFAATQDIGDFFMLQDGKYGRGVINSSKIKIILGLEDNEIRVLETVLDITAEEKRAIRHFQRGQGLLYAGNNHINVEFRASANEHSLITTDRSDLAAMRADRR